MHIDRWLRIIGGFLVLMSVTLAHFHSLNWLWFTGFVGLNLFQSGFTKWCPMVTVLGKLGVPKSPKDCCN